MEPTTPEAGSYRHARRGGDRRHRYPGRTRQVFVRLSSDEYEDLAEAAARVELTPTGYVAETALAAARGQGTPGLADGTATTRAELAQLQRELFAARTELVRVGTNLNQAVADLHATGTTPAGLHDTVTRCAQAMEALDSVVAAIDRRLR